jgi:hypothetical protein
MAGPRRKVPPVPVPHGQKFCFKCMTAKPVEAFAVDRATWDQRRTICGSCDDKRRMAHYHACNRLKEIKGRLEASLTAPAVPVRFPSRPPKVTGEPRPVPRSCIVNGEIHRPTVAALRRKLDEPVRESRW